MDRRKLRAWWYGRQCLNHRNPELAAAQLLSAVGWARSVGGANPYLTLFSRTGIRREAVDRALAGQEIHELPSARGCTYVVPRSDFALALKVGQGFSDEAAMVTARKFLGVTDAEIEKLMTQVESALATEHLDPKEIRERVGDAVRSLGEEGKKRGQSTTLSLALGFLQSQGRIRRIPVGGRLDQQRYTYALWSPSPLAGTAMSASEAYRELACLYFKWAGPATIGHFRWFSGLGVNVSRNAIADLDLVDVGDGYLASRVDAESFRSFVPSDEPSYALVAGIDSHLLLRRDLENLVEAEDSDRQMAGEKGLVSVGGVQDLANQAILDRGRVVGIWEFDSKASEIVWHTYRPASDDLRKAIDATEHFIREDLGDFRSFSLDNPASRRTKLDLIRRLG